MGGLVTEEDHQRPGEQCGEHEDTSEFSRLAAERAAA